MGDYIGWAVKRMIEGFKVRRAGWNGAGMYLFYVPGRKGITLKAGTPYAQARGEVTVDIDARIDMFTAQGTFQPGWLCSQADLLAQDWEVVDE